MTPSRLATLHAVASCTFYQPKGDERECEELAKLGYIRPAQQGKLSGYGLALPGTVYLRKRAGYE